MLECSQKWEQAHYMWKLGKKDFWQWDDVKLGLHGLYEMKNAITTFPERLHFCHHETHDDRNRLHKFKAAVLDEVLLGNIWTHIEPLKESVKQMRLAYNQKNYALAGQRFAHVLTELAGGVIPNKDGSIPASKVVKQTNFNATEIAAGLINGLTKNDVTYPLIDCFENHHEFVY